MFVAPNAYTKKKNGFFLKDALWGGGVPTGAGLVDGGGRPRALIPGEGVREGLAWRGKRAPIHRSWLGGRGVREAEQGLGGGGVQGLRFRGG